MSDQELNLEDLFNNSFDQELTEFWQEMEKEVEEEEALASEAEDDNSFLNWIETQPPNQEIKSRQPSKLRTSSAENLEASSLWEAFNDTPSTAQNESKNKDNSGNLEDWFSHTAPPTERLPPVLPRLLPLYPQWEQLESLIEQNVESLTPSIDIATLEALIAATPQQDSTRTSIPPSHSPTTQKETADPTFPGLDDLLGQVEQTLVSAGVKELPNSDQSLSSRYQLSKGRIFDQTMRVPIRQLDNLANLIGELVIQRNQMERHQNRLRQVLETLLGQVQKLGEVGIKTQDQYERSLLEGALIASRRKSSPSKSTFAIESFSSQGTPQADDGLDALEMDRFTGFHLLSQEIIERIVRVQESASDIEYLVGASEEVARNLGQVTTQLQEGMTKSRMVPFSQAADRLPRAVREISLRLNKQVTLQVEGRDVLIDKMILENLSSPINHLINNAITHGIESVPRRRQRGKKPNGNVTIRAFIQGNQTVISITDDGEGINLEEVKAKAIAKNILSAEQANNLNQQELYHLLFSPGFSTKDNADDFSGRGVGLDVVQTSLRELRGSIGVESKPSQGTKFTIRLPLTRNICKALPCLIAQTHLAFPLEVVEDTLEIEPSQLKPNQQGHIYVTWNNNLIPCYQLNKLLSYNYPRFIKDLYSTRQDSEKIDLIILRCNTELIAVQVDRLLSEQEIVIKPIEGPSPKPPGIAGATVLGDGKIMLVGDVIELVEIAQGQLRIDGSLPSWKQTMISTREEQIQLYSEHREPMVLIVDDSITVRELLSLSFNKAGYLVEQARDGQEALEKLSSGLPCDLIFCDIEMPRMNGLELLSELQRDEELSKIPFALLTSRGADRHRQVAAKLGASGYLTKPYTEKALLDAAERMIQGEVIFASGSY